MRVSGGFDEGGVIAGNAYDKYGSGNPLVRRIMAGFYQSLDELLQMASPVSIHEVGCGEGFWVTNWLRRGFEARGSDYSSRVIELARSNAAETGLPENVFTQKSIYDLTAENDGADLVVCCEVLEHLEDPEAGLKALQRVTTNHLILSVPREPIWRLLNVARGKYLSELGNTPGHLQHWSRAGFVSLVERYFDVLELRTPLPWTMLLCRPKG